MSKTIANDNGDDVLPERDAVEFLDQRLGKVSLRTVRRWHAKGVGPPRIKINGRVAYRKSALLDWIMAAEHVPPRSHRAG